MSARLKVILTRRLPDSVETRMRELFDAELNLDDHAMGKDELKAAVARADVLVPTITDVIDAEVIEAAGDRLRLIANFGAGVDHIDIAAAAARKIIVSNTPGVLAEDTADMAMALILAVRRRLIEGAALMSQGDFAGWTPTAMLGRRLWGSRLGIVGMGRIGQALARRAKAFGMQVHYHNRHRLNVGLEEELGATYWDSLEAMLPRMDVVSLNCPATPETYHLMSAERLALMKPDAVLINTARGEVVDEAALVAALDRRALAGAGLDVYEHEPAVNPGLVNRPEVVLMPHMASATQESREDMGERVILNIKTLENGHRPPDRLLPPMA
ncbi:2-hydroxyacid dehydrogenase [Brevundimonas aveniformis]|uniref:2-hydroxyacid dehydrogenase n=1 Tax=Brevundimonas aveniformis TaxID=370977 RepID=UPI000410E276|nr:D-glycerate dehydrogenase [Brevundimonas aveniformis]